MNRSIYEITQIDTSKWLLHIKHPGTTYLSSKTFTELEDLNKYIQVLKNSGYINSSISKG